MNNINFIELTEVANDFVTREQVERLARRYYWAASLAEGKDVLEVACGTGQGLGLLLRKSRSVTAGDNYEAILSMARKHYRDRLKLLKFDAEKLPFENKSFDIIIIFEALYYLPNPNQFFNECARVLRPGGLLLISNANKDLYDFTPSPHSHIYHGVLELYHELKKRSFECEFYGDTPVEKVSWVQRFLRPIKAVASKSGLIPKSMAGKKLLKRLVFGKLVAMPPEINDLTATHIDPCPLVPDAKDHLHKVIFCRAQLFD